MTVDQKALKNLVESALDKAQNGVLVVSQVIQLYQSIAGVELTDSKLLVAVVRSDSSILFKRGIKGFVLALPNKLEAFSDGVERWKKYILRESCKGSVPKCDVIEKCMKSRSHLSFGFYSAEDFIASAVNALKSDNEIFYDESCGSFAKTRSKNSFQEDEQKIEPLPTIDDILTNYDPNRLGEIGVSSSSYLRSVVIPDWKQQIEDAQEPLHISQIFDEEKKQWEWKSMGYENVEQMAYALYEWLAATVSAARLGSGMVIVPAPPHVSVLHHHW